MARHFVLYLKFCTLGWIFYGGNASGNGEPRERFHRSLKRCWNLLPRSPVDPAIPVDLLPDYCHLSENVIASRNTDTQTMR